MEINDHIESVNQTHKQRLLEILNILNLMISLLIQEALVEPLAQK